MPLPIIFKKKSSQYSEPCLFVPPKFNPDNIAQWKKTNINADQNQNGLDDRLEEKWNFLGESEAVDKEVFVGQADTLENGLSENISIVIQFPQGDINSICSLFEGFGGEIKMIYDIALNGFAGSINYRGLREFYNILIREQVPFLMEEDSFVKASLYYATRSMNLRPYVWNSLSFTGDAGSSIAIIDTGIDDSHTFLAPGYSEGNWNYKIVGWRDILNNLSSPYDDSGHGSHCAGIAAGNGTSTLDSYGRTMVTCAYEYYRPGISEFNHIINKILARFNVTYPSTVEINCAGLDLTPNVPSEHADVRAYLYHNETIMDSYILLSESWNHTLGYNVTTATLGDYSLRIAIVLRSFGGMVTSPHMKFRAQIYWPFNASEMNGGNPWKGVAPMTHLVSVKALNNYGVGILSDILEGINWVIANKRTYNISVLSLSLSGAAGQPSLITAVNNAFENGIVVVAAAGNNGGMNNGIGSPGDADNVITVAAMNDADNVTRYSSAGGLSASGNTIKPDLMAPGGSNYSFSIFSIDTNDNDGEGAFPQELVQNDLYPAAGTSMAAPAVAGAANLLIEAMGGSSNWNYSALEAKKVKALLLMTATETYPMHREVDTNYSPSLERGGKDIHEGYGRLNIDGALEACTQELTLGSSKTAWLSSSYLNSFSKHALGCYVNLISGQTYCFKLVTPINADFDLYLYSETPTSTGEPQLLAASTSNNSGKSEIIRYTPITSGKYFLIAKAIFGNGQATISNIPNNFTPLLLNGSVSPQTGNQSALYNFSITYSDIDDYSPLFMNLVINGTATPMIKQNPSDENYTDGCFFQYLSYLQPGNYNYSFECSDGKFFTSFIPSTWLVVNRTNSLGPTLLNPRVFPEIGGNFTCFNFRVIYLDSDNNFPTYVNITINATSYIMAPVNQLDDNMMDGADYYFKAALKYGYYRFQITCSDGFFLNATGWINFPVVTPFYNFSEELIVINEVFTAHPSFIELYNYGIDKNLTGWTLQIYYNNVLIRIYEFPSGWIFHKQYIVVLHEKWGAINGTNNATDLFTDWGIPWDSGGIAVGLFDNKGYHKDWFQTSEFTGTRPGDVKWTQNSPIVLSSNYAFRISDEDTNSASDWWVDNLGMPGTLNPGQTGERQNSLLTNLLQPLNNSVFFSGEINFSWISLELPIEPVNYTLQISNLSDFSNIGYEKREIQEITNITSTNISITFVSGQYFWRVCPTHGIFNGFWSDYSIFNLICNEFSPKLVNGKVIPTLGTQYTNFNFSVIYMDSDNNPPISVNISINEQVFSLEKQNSSDVNHVDGCLYQFQTPLKSGIYNYSFKCSDGKFINETDLYCNLNVTDINIAPPILTNGQLYPNIGYENATLFRFMVNYTDPDNNAPIYLEVTINSTIYSMIQQDPLDFNYKDGSIFIFSTFLKKGTYNFYFNCSDGSYLDSQGPYNGPTVEFSVEWDQLPLDKVRVGAVITHGETNPRTKFMFYPYVTWELIQRGINITDITEVLTLDLLSNYDMIWFGPRGVDMNAEEIEAVEEWIKEGGRLLISGYSIDGGSAINLIQHFNLTYSSETTGGYTDEIYFHPITNRVYQIYSQLPIATLNISAQPNANVCVTINEYNVVVAMELGKGRMVIICDDHIITDKILGDNHQFINNTFGWLGYRSEYSPVLLNEKINPPTGNQFTQFNFTALYTDLDNNAPQFVNVVINGTHYTMQKQDAMNMNYSNGCLYQLVTTLTPGTYVYSFECSDGVFYYSNNSLRWFTVYETNDFQPTTSPFWTWIIIGVSTIAVILFRLNQKANLNFIVKMKFLYLINREK